MHQRPSKRTFFQRKIVSQIEEVKERIKEREYLVALKRGEDVQTSGRSNRDEEKGGKTVIFSQNGKRVFVSFSKNGLYSQKGKSKKKTLKIKRKSLRYPVSLLSGNYFISFTLFSPHVTSQFWAFSFFLFPFPFFFPLDLVVFLRNHFFSFSFSFHVHPSFLFNFITSESDLQKS